MARKNMATEMQQLDKALRFARKNISTDITAQRLLIHGKQQAAIQPLNELATSSAQSLRVDPLNLRVKRVFLTAKGRRFMDRWFDAMSRP